LAIQASRGHRSGHSAAGDGERKSGWLGPSTDRRYIEHGKPAFSWRSPARGHLRIMRTTAILAMAIAALWAEGAGADSFRCGTRLVSDGDSIDKVAALCGPPTDIQRREVLQRPIRWYRGRPYYTSYEPEPIPIEYWTYNLGPNKLMTRLKFEDGLLVDVETLSHGYDSERVD